MNKNKIMRISDSSIVNRMPQVLKRVKNTIELKKRMINPSQNEYQIRLTA